MTRIQALSFLSLLVVVGCRSAPNVREEAPVQVGEASERWRLEWRTSPQPVCSPGTPDAATCPCTGFSYGEMANVDLLRQRSSGADERLELAPLFRDEDGPGNDGRPVLQRWPMFAPDPSDVGDDSSSVQRMKSRAPVRLIKLGDYDHDGRATEFVLQVGTMPCGKRELVLLGVSKAAPSLHAFGSVAHPDRPLILEAHIWAELLKSAGSVSAIEWACGDHGSDTQTEVRIAATPSGFDGSRLEYECTPSNNVGKLLSTTRL